MAERKQKKAKKRTALTTGAAVVPALSSPGALIELSDKEIVERLLAVPDPRGAVQSLSRQDYYWLIKNADEEWLALIALGSERQWQYLLDLELWTKDRIDPERMKLWMERYAEADPERFAKWLLTEDLSLAYAYLNQMVEIIKVDPDEEDRDIPEGFFSFDGVTFVRPRDDESYHVVRAVLDAMARVDMERCEWVLTTLGGIVPAEMEEEMYHFRNARLADDGFLPFDEALAVYVPLDPSVLKDGSFHGTTIEMHGDEEEEIPPRLPLARAAAGEVLGKALETLARDPIIERLSSEFAGLTNRIIAADGLEGRELEDMVGAARKAGSYVNLALEFRAGGDVNEAAVLLRKNPVPALFQVGYGLVHRVVKEAKNFEKQSWFRSAGIPRSFWGEPMGKVLIGLLDKRPKFYEAQAAVPGYRDFEKIQDLESARETLKNLELLDDLFARLDCRWPLDRHLASSPDVTFETLLITRHARAVTGEDPGFGGMSLEGARKFLDLAREGEEGPPYRMEHMGRLFALELIDIVSENGDLLSSDRERLEDLLSVVWSNFQEEYENVESADLSPRYSRLILIIDETL